MTWCGHIPGVACDNCRKGWRELHRGEWRVPVEITKGWGVSTTFDPILGHYDGISLVDEFDSGIRKNRS